MATLSANIAARIRRSRPDGASHRVFGSIAADAYPHFLWIRLCTDAQKLF
jgi:hypothetical protein